MDDCIYTAQDKSATYMYNSTINIFFLYYMCDERGNIVSYLCIRHSHLETADVSKHLILTTNGKATTSCQLPAVALSFSSPLHHIFINEKKNKVFLFSTTEILSSLQMHQS